MPKKVVSRPAKKKVVPLTILLIKEGTKDGDLFDPNPDGEIKDFPVEVDGRNIGTLRIKQTPEHPPGWAQFFSGAADFGRKDARSSSVSAAFATRAANRLFVICFGHGRHLVNAGVIEERFGLRTTLNSVDPDQLRAVDVTTLEANPVHGTRQPSRAAPLGEFGLNLDQDLMRGVTGKPLEEALGTSMAGADSLSVRAQTDLRDVRKLLSKYLEKSKEEKYKERFSWVDHVAEVRNPELKDDLFALLVESLCQRNSFVWAAIPERVDWANFDIFRFGTPASDIEYDDITLDRMFRSLDGESPSLEVLKRKQVFCYQAGSRQPVVHWPFLRCLTAEIPHQGARYLLNAGVWFRIDTDFVQRVEADVSAIPISTIDLGEWGDETEAEYNERIADKSGGSLCLMDRKMVICDGMASPIEFCDLFSLSGQMIHVKRYGQSSVLSHLFSQGAVAATMALSDAAFRRAANVKLPESHRFKKPDERLEPSKYEVCFAIGSSESGRLKLPFFSQVTLRSAYRTLHDMHGFHVTTAKINVSKLTDIKAAVARPSRSPKAAQRE